MAFAARISYSKAGIVLLVSLIISSTWLIFPYFIQGKQLLSDTGAGARMTKGGRVSLYLTRYLVDHPELELTATFATDEFFQYVDRANVVGNLRPDRNFIFFVSENIHEGQLAFDLPEVELHIGDKVYAPERSIGPNLAEHHRITVYSIPKRDRDGSIIDIEQHDGVRLFVSNYYLDSEDKLTFIGRWDAPYELPEELTSRADITPVAMLALGAGLLSSVLTPCLLQLVVIFGSIISSFATVPGEAGLSTSQLTPHIRRKVMQIALAFVIGFTLLYTLAGAVIGHVGHTAQLLFSEYSRTVTVVSGIVVILMGIWIGIRGTRNIACRIPDRRAMSTANRRDAASSLLVSMGYALGCTACFGGAIVATLIIYVGAIGSAAIGAGIMATFSLGVAIPFLLAAYFMSRMESVLVLLASKARAISFFSMILIIVFGLILITDNFHVVSDAIYPYLGLS
ncbi:MAG: cytochrome c biogenesis protein CcdA [Gammaproteobacteria bacterium]|nr:cytochrome c biogenesis protein CcdA [Gammaproteobacteria bacterium]